jgi:hypothetical protein
MLLGRRTGLVVALSVVVEVADLPLVGGSVVPAGIPEIVHALGFSVGGGAASRAARSTIQTRARPIWFRVTNGGNRPNCLRAVNPLSFSRRRSGSGAVADR